MLTPRQIIETSFLEARHMLLEVAALLDRHDAAVARAADGSTADAATAEKLAVLREALAVLAARDSSRERTVALLELFARV